MTVNGHVLDSPALNVEPGDHVTVDGRPLPAPAPLKLWRYHKPKGRVTTHRDPQGRPTVFEALGPEMPRVLSVGRLDINTEGLLLLTTDGGLSRHMELPSTGWLRRYRVRAKGRVTQETLDKLQSGIKIKGIRYGPIEARIDRVQGANSWLTMGLREGKNREIKHVLEHLGLSVNRLIRISYGPFPLGELKPGQYVEVKRRVIAEQLGTKTAEELGISKSHKRGGPKRPTPPA
ncbi:ribosomal large subunit pseudouridine synthase B [bacterium MnTg02]|nr:ribosomal large subunit pseudouridine synthase B [bacterium MnTg02]